jgi:hypothetical protein
MWTSCAQHRGYGCIKKLGCDILELPLNDLPGRSSSKIQPLSSIKQRSSPTGRFPETKPDPSSGLVLLQLLHPQAATLDSGDVYYREKDLHQFILLQ